VSGEAEEEAEHVPLFDGNNRRRSAKVTGVGIISISALKSE
jgi:hypothetical protein